MLRKVAGTNLLSAVMTGLLLRVVFAGPSPNAGLAPALSVRPEERVFVIERMAAIALRFPQVHSGRADSAEHILPRRDFPKMLWVNARSISANVVNHSQHSECSPFWTFSQKRSRSSADRSIVFRVAFIASPPIN